MYKRALAFSSFFLLQTSLLAMDLNETDKIINEASVATQQLQVQFDSLINENNTTTKVATEGSSADGLMIYKIRIKPYCKMSGETFAKQYTQEDWDDIYDEHEFKKEVLKACPKIEKEYKDKWTVDLYQFTLEYASDSDAIPEC